MKAWIVVDATMLLEVPDTLGELAQMALDNCEAVEMYDTEREARNAAMTYIHEGGNNVRILEF